MKKQFIPILISLFSLNLFGQSGGGTRIERKLERLADDIERISERLASKTEQLEASAEEFAQVIEEQWDKNWSVALNDFSDEIFTAVCPEVGYLGIEASELPEEKAKKLGFENRYGSYVSKVLAKSSAETAGLKAFDYIYGVDEQRTSNNQSLAEILEDYEPGDEVTVYFVRKGQKLTAKVKLSDNFYGEALDFQGDSRPFLGISSKEENMDEAFDGVEVDIVEKSTAEEMGLQVGDVITSINGFPVLDWTDVTTAIQNTNPGENIEVSFKRGEKELSAKGTIKSYDEVYPNGNGSWNLDVDWDQTGQVEAISGDDWQQDEDWEQDENRPFIGIFTEMISKEKANKLRFDNQYGTYVTGIIPNSGADKAGLRPFDYIYGFDEYRAGEQQSLGAILKKFKPGDKTTVHFIRKGKRTTAPLVFTKPIKAEKKETNSCQDPFFGIVQSGINVEMEGVTISPQKGTTAYEMGMQNGDVITQINGYQIVDWQDVTTAIGMIAPGETISVSFLRAGKEMKLAKPIKSLAETKNCPNCDCGEKESVVIATTPGTSFFRGKTEQGSSTSSVPRMSIDKVTVNLNSLSTDDANRLSKHGVKLPESSTLVVENIKLKPNSTTGMFELEFNLPSSGNTVVRIFNASGRSLYEYDLGEFSGKFNDNMDIAQNGPGDYFLEISQSGKVYSKKVTLSKD